MSESADGVNVAATRQNSGSRANSDAAAAGAGVPGRVKVPGATLCAVVTFAFGRLNAAIDSQDAADADAAGNAVVVNTNAATYVSGLIPWPLVMFVSFVGLFVLRDLRRYGCLHTKFAASSMLPLPL
jgi:hypothetical protein